jgi:hypothetical protein
VAVHGAGHGVWGWGGHSKGFLARVPVHCPSLLPLQSPMTLSLKSSACISGPCSQYRTSGAKQPRLPPRPERLLRSGHPGLKLADQHALLPRHLDFQPHGEAAATLLSFASFPLSLCSPLHSMLTVLPLALLCAALQVGVVFANGSGTDLSMDHHRFYPYAVLWSNINLGRGEAKSGREGREGTALASILPSFPPLPVPGLLTLSPPTLLPTPPHQQARGPS